MIVKNKQVLVCFFYISLYWLHRNDKKCGFNFIFIFCLFMIDLSCTCPIKIVIQPHKEQQSAQMAFNTIYQFRCFKLMLSQSQNITDWKKVSCLFTHTFNVYWKIAQGTRLCLEKNIIFSQWTAKYAFISPVSRGAPFTNS